MRRFRILIPEDSVTGGPEALHQLQWALSELGHDVSATYVHRHVPYWYRMLRKFDRSRGLTFETPQVLQAFTGHGALSAKLPAWPPLVLSVSSTAVPEPYRKYAPTIERAMPVDRPDTVVVIPETMWPAARRWSRATVALWWLSIDNAVEFPGAIRAMRRPNVLHLAQSHYAESVVRASGARRVLRVSDFLDFQLPATDGTERREEVVLYNPRKGVEVTSALRAQLPGVTFVPIEGLDRKGVWDLLAGSKVYIDFGHFPGRDRLPREALAAGCIVIAGKRGASGFAADLPIPDEYSIAADDIGTIARTVVASLEDFDARVHEFAAARRWVAMADQTFLREVERFADSTASSAFALLGARLAAARGSTET